MKRIYLHIGFHKTATSSFQATCMSNQGQLEKQGFFYPAFKVAGGNTRNHGIPIVTIFSEDAENYHVNIRQGHTDDIDPIRKDYTQQLERILDAHDTVILSGEDIGAQDQDCLGRIKAFFETRGFDLKVYCGIRKPYSYMCSALQQKIKGGSTSLIPPLPVPVKSREHQ